MSYLPKNELTPDDGDKKRPSNTRLALWIIVGAVGLYMVGSGIFGILTK